MPDLELLLSVGLPLAGIAAFSAAILASFVMEGQRRGVFVMSVRGLPQTICSDDGRRIEQVRGSGVVRLELEPTEGTPIWRATAGVCGGGQRNAVGGAGSGTDLRSFTDDKQALELLGQIGGDCEVFVSSSGVVSVEVAKTGWDVRQVVGLLELTATLANGCR